MTGSRIGELRERRMEVRGRRKGKGETKRVSIF